MEKLYRDDVRDKGIKNELVKWSKILEEKLIIRW